MKKSLFSAIFFLAIILNNNVIGQNCIVTGESDWEKVEVKEMIVKEISDSLNVTGESTIKIASKINSIADLTKKELTEIKKIAAKYNSCLVYLDIKGFWDGTNFPTMASQNLLYFYWVKEK
jgi:carbonic anhydrase/acetyltransferase-like protein (isoleucine patch superfamily)